MSKLRNKPKILLVEDNVADVKLTIKGLRKNNIDVDMDIINKGDEVLEYLNDKYNSSDLPDLILLDINLPKVNGFQILDVIKKNNKFRMIPVIMLTSSDDEEDINKSYNLYANGFIKKKLKLNDFYASMISLKQYWFKTSKLPII